MKKEIVLSGIRPTGNLHLGNYFGALRNFIKMQEEYECYHLLLPKIHSSIHLPLILIRKTYTTTYAKYL